MSVKVSMPRIIKQYYLGEKPAKVKQEDLSYVPVALGHASISLRQSSTGISKIRECFHISTIRDEILTVNWKKAYDIDIELSCLADEPLGSINYHELPEAASFAKNYDLWKKDYANWLYKSQSLTLFQNKALKLISEPGQSKHDFEKKLKDAANKKHQEELSKVDSEYNSKIETAKERLRKSEQALSREKQQARHQGFQTFISFISTILSSIIGKKKLNSSSLSRATTTARGASRTVKEHSDIARAKETVQANEDRLSKLVSEYDQAKEKLIDKKDNEYLSIEELILRPSKQHINVKVMAFVWCLHQRGSDGHWHPVIKNRI